MSLRGKRSALNIPNHNETFVFWEVLKTCCIIFAANSHQASQMSFDKTFMTQTNMTCRASDVLVWSLKITPPAFWWGSVALPTRRYQPHRCWLVNWPSEESLYLRGWSANIPHAHTHVSPISRHASIHTHTHTSTIPSAGETSFPLNLIMAKAMSLM